MKELIEFLEKEKFIRDAEHLKKNNVELSLETIYFAILGI